MADADRILRTLVVGEPPSTRVHEDERHVVPRCDGDPQRLPWTPGPGAPEAIRAAAAGRTA